MSQSDSPSYAFRPHEQPIMLGSPYAPDHPGLRRLGYVLLALLTGITGGLGNNLVSANLAYVQGGLQLTPDEAAMLPTVYSATYICANLVLVKLRQQFGLVQFVRWILGAYAAITLAHFWVDSFGSALLVRAASGIAAGGLTTICVLSMMQAAPPAKRLAAVMVGIAVPQLATPLARALTPMLYDWGDWHMAYGFECTLALATLAGLMALPLPPSKRASVFRAGDALTLALVFPAVSCLCVVLGLGRLVWWAERPWIIWASAAGLVLLAIAWLFERRRSDPLLQVHWLGRPEILGLLLVAAALRVLTSEQSYAAVGLMAVLGMGPDQMAGLFWLVTLISALAIAASLLLFRPRYPYFNLILACGCIGLAALLDAQATDLVRPANLWLSQSLAGFGALLFIGPIFLIGIANMLLAGTENFISWVVLFNASQTLGGLAGSALFGTFETVREKFHSHALVQHVILADPINSQAAGAGAQLLRSQLGDPVLRNGESLALLAARASREAHVLAFNDVFLVIAVLAGIGFAGGLLFHTIYRLRGIKSPIIVLSEQMAANALRQKTAGVGQKGTKP